MIHTYCPGITIDSGQARGYDNFAVAGKWNRARETMRVRLSGTTPLLRPSQAYIDKVTRLLDSIAATGIGNALLQHFVANPIRIAMPAINIAVTCHRTGASPNTARSGGANFLEPIGNAAGAQATFQTALNAAHADGVASAQLAQAINHATLQAGINLVVNANQIDDWCTGVSALPDENTYEFRFLVYTLERWLPPDAGAGTRVSFDPWNRLTGQAERHPRIGLFHELVHAYTNCTGRQIFSDDQPPNELITIGIAPFDQIANGGGARPYTENAFRNALGVPPRQTL